MSGAGSKAIRVYDARSGDELRTYAVPEAGFINDVIVTRRGAYFTDSGVQQLYFVPCGKKGALGELQRIPLTGDLQYDDDPGTFELNGIEAARGGKTLVAIQSHNGKLFAIDARTGVTDEIAYDGGDGLLRQGRRLFVVENRDTNAGTTTVGEVSVVKLRRHLSQDRIVREIVDSDFDVPTTIARSGGREYVVNAKFGQNTPDQTYEVVKVPKK